MAASAYSARPLGLCCSEAELCQTLQPHGLLHTKHLCPLLSPVVYSNSCPLRWWCYLTWWCYLSLSSSAAPISFCRQSFPASGSFLMRQLFASIGQGIKASASPLVLSMTIQGWSPLGLTGWISLQSKGLSRVFSNTVAQKHQFFGLLSGPTLTSIRDYWKNHSFAYMDLCWQSDISAFKYAA